MISPSQIATAFELVGRDAPLATFKPLRPTAALLAVADAEADYRAHCRENFEGVSDGLVKVDEILLDGIATQVARLARSLADIGGHASFIDARPDRADLIEQLGDLIEDALGGPVGAVVRAQARALAER